MSEELKNMLDSFVKYVIGIVDLKEYKEEIANKYNELIDFYGKLYILTSEDFESFQKELSETESLQEQIKAYKAQKEIDQDKIKSMMSELANNIELTEKHKKLNEDYNALVQKYNVVYNENTGNQMKLKNNENLINDLQKEISNVKKENFEKFEKINELEKNYKLCEMKLNQANEKINKITIENNDLTKNNTELKNNYLEQQKNYQNKLLITERQIQQLTESNKNFVEENGSLEKNIKELKLYTSLAAQGKITLDKQQFSILEIMSQRAERAELEVQKLMAYTDELKDLNEKLINKIKPLEDYALLQIKHDHEINTGIDTIYDLKNKVLTDDERLEIDKLKNEPNELLQSLIKLKTENLELHNQLKDITIECNQQLREAKRK
jgi:chromosome segregation ATPase